MAKKRKTRNYYAAKAVRDEDMPFICAGDCETEGLGGKILSLQWGTFESETVTVDISENMVSNFFDVFLEYPKPCVWFFHFGQYDWRYFIEHIEQAGYLVQIGMRTETDIYEIRVRRTAQDSWSIMRDSYALWSHKLEDLASNFCPEIPKLEIDFSNVQFDPHNPDHIEYAKRDVEILLKGLPRLWDMVYEHFNVYPGATAAGTAMKAWQKTLPADKYYDGSEWGAEEMFIRQGYYGGLVFLTTNRTVLDCETYDRNSSYPASMDEFGVPIGKPIYTTDYEESYTGFYRVRVRTPDDLIVPILPARNKSGGMRWYRGEFETVVSTQELQFAAKHGYEIQEIYEGYIFEGVDFPFHEIIAKCKHIRSAYKRLTPEQLAKLIQNSLYGRFAARRDRTRLINSREMDDEDFIGSLPFDESGFWYVKQELDESMLCLPQWAAYITANARLNLLKNVYNVGPENCLYGDTDSITIKKGYGHLIDTGLEYGQWKREKAWQYFRPIAPKVYSGVLSEDLDERHPAGSFYGAAKGMPAKGMTDQHWKDLIEDGATSAQALSLTSLKVAMKQGVRPAHMLTRKSSTLDNSMNFGVDAEGQVRVKFAHG